MLNSRVSLAANPAPVNSRSKSAKTSGVTWVQEENLTPSYDSALVQSSSANTSSVQIKLAKIMFYSFYWKHTHLWEAIYNGYQPG